MTNAMYKSAEGERAVMAFYNRVLEHWPVTSEHLHLPTRLGNTFVIASGDPAAPPLVLLHGASSNALTWAGDAAAFSRHFRVYAVDIPGEAGRSARNRPSWDGEAYVEWLEDLLDALGAPRAALVGLSLGGWMAMRFAFRHPERVSKLVALAPGGVVPVRVVSCAGDRAVGAGPPRH